MAFHINVCNHILPSFNLVKSINTESEDYIFDVTATPEYAITSSSDQCIRLYDLSTLQLTQTIPAHEDKICKIKARDQYLFSAGEEGVLKRWDLRMKGLAQEYKYKRGLSAFDINCNDSMVIMGTEFLGDTCQVELAFFDTRHQSLLSVFTDCHNEDITEIQCHPTLPTQFISSSTDGLINHYDVTDMDEQEDIISVMNSFSSVNKTGYFGPSSEYIYCLTHIETFILYTLEGDEIFNFGDIRNINTTQVDFAIDCSYDPVTQRFYLLTGDKTGTVDFFHVNIGELQHCQQLKGHNDIVRSLYWHHPTQSILTGGEDNRVCFWGAVV
ncbi:WD40-repeat-containing domain protein [Pilobolus umbonatus]|nr:WD40-repeat-containing domain protein [Pilobolus umbonatus]